MTKRVALIGFGEAGSTFARAGDWDGFACAYDILLERRAEMAGLGIASTDSAEEALKGAQLVLSLVTADQALNAARTYAGFIEPGAIWCDMNSVAPETKRASARAVEAAGGRYVDVAVMAPVEPARLSVPLLLAGEAAGDAKALLAALGFGNIAIAGREVGRASAIKLCRSIMVKGMEALTAEMAIAAERAGVLDEVLASLDASEKSRPWAERAEYNLERMATHGMRRAAEMEEAAAMLRDLGIEPAMTDGTVRRQREAAQAKTEFKRTAA